MTLEEVSQVCMEKFPNLVKQIYIQDARRNRIRLILVDDSFLDIHQNPNQRYSYHWQQGDISYRFNNAPHYDQVETTPHHFHDQDNNVHDSPVLGVTPSDITVVLRFVDSHLSKK